MVPPSSDTPPSAPELSAQTIIDRIQHDLWEAKDNLVKAKVSQAVQANKHRNNTFPFEVGQRVRLSTLHR